MKKTTIVIPNYNGIKYMENCLKSLMGCESQDFDIIVVDNCSTDGSKDVAKSFGSVKVIELKDNTGFAFAVNEGIKASTTDYVLLLNNDIEVEPDFVDKLEKAIEEDEKIFSVNSKMISMSDRNVLDGCGDYYCALGWAYAYGKGKSATKNNVKRNIFSACGGASIYRRKLFDEIGLFDEAHFAYLEDVDVGYRAKLYGYKNVYEPSAVCYHAGSGSSGSRYNEFKIKLSSRNSTYIIHKNMPLLQRIINLPFFIAGFGIKLLFFTLKGYGGLYLKGLFEGIKLGMTKEGRMKKIKLTPSHIINMIGIQFELWINILRRFCA